MFALDCGSTINPDLVRAQLEGGLLFGLSAAAWGEVVLGDHGEIVTQNFDRYQVVRMGSGSAVSTCSATSTRSRWSSRYGSTTDASARSASATEDPLAWPSQRRFAAATGST